MEIELASVNCCFDPTTQKKTINMKVDVPTRCGSGSHVDEAIEVVAEEYRKIGWRVTSDLRHDRVWFYFECPADSLREKSPEKV